MSANAEGKVRGRRTWLRILLAVGIGCYVIAAMYLVDGLNSSFLAFFWIVHGVALIGPMRRMGAKESSAGAALFIVVTSLPRSVQELVQRASTSA